MDLLDKIIMDEANSVTAEDFERMTGEKLEAHMSRMKDFVAEVKARTAAAEQEQGEARVIRMAFGHQKEADEALPLAASAKKGKKK